MLVLTEVYPAGEAPIVGADGRALARAVRVRGKVDPVLVEHPRELRARRCPTLLRDGDLLLLMGAGDIGAAAQQLAQHGLRGSRPDEQPIRRMKVTDPPTSAASPW